MQTEPDAFRAEARAWLETAVAAAPPDYGAILPPSLYAEGVGWQRQLVAAGWAGLTWPVDYGGRGLPTSHLLIWIEECARVEVPPFINMVGIVLAGGAILMFGTPAQKERFLRATLSSDIVWCQLFSEPGAGSDLAGLSTKAERVGDTFVVTGQKVWCSGGRYSDWGILLARTSSDQPRHKGISLLLLDMRSPGVEVRPLRQMTGAAEFDEVFLTEVVVSAECLLGPLNGGWDVAMAVLAEERNYIGALVMGLERRIKAIATSDHTLDDLQRQELALLVARARTLASLERRQGPSASMAASLLKLGVSELMFDVAMFRSRLAGLGGLVDGDVSEVLAAPAPRIAGGTSQVQRNIIGERLLGLPREPTPQTAQHKQTRS